MFGEKYVSDIDDILSMAAWCTTFGVWCTMLYPKSAAQAATSLVEQRGVQGCTPCLA